MGLYTRHGGQGGKFNPGAFGDLGLRAYAEARDREIKVAEKQLQQEQQYSRQHLQQIEGSGAKKIQHNRMLQDLKQDVSQLALNNTELRGKREVEEILGRAKEAEKESAFWKDFSTTYSGQYAKAAGELYDYATEIQHQRQMDAFRKNPDAQKSMNEFGHLNELGTKNLAVDAYKAFRDKGITDANARSMVLAQYSDLGLRMNHKTKMALSNMILKKWAGQEALIKEEMARQKIAPTRENIHEYYKLRGHELLKEFGISPTSIAGRHLLNGIFDKSLDKGIEVNNFDIANDHINIHTRQKTQVQNLISKIKFAKDPETGLQTATGDSIGNFVSGWQQMVLHHATMYRLTEGGQVIEPKYGSKPNLALSHQVLGVEFIEAGYFNSWEQIENHLINTPLLSEKDPYNIVQVADETTISFKEKEVWGKNISHREVFEEAWKKRKLKIATETAQEQAATDELALIEIDERRQLDPSDDRYIDVKNPEHLTKALNTYDGKEKTTKMLRDFQIFNQFDKQATVVNQSLTALWKDADLPNLTEYIRHLDGEEKEIWTGRKNQLALLNRIGLDKAGITSQVTKYLHMIVNDESVKKDLSLYADTRGDIKQEILKQLDIIESDKTLSQLGDQAKWVEIDKRIKEQMDLDSAGRTGPEGDTVRGYGIFRRKGEKLQTKFLAWDHDEDSEATSDQIQGKLKYKENWNTMFMQLADPKNSGKVAVIHPKTKKEVFLPMISLDNADAIIRAIDGGTPIPSNETIKWLTENQPTRLDGTNYTEREITNLILEGLGVRKKVPQGGIEFANYILKIEKPSIDYKLQPDNMSKEDFEKWWENSTETDINDLRKENESYGTSISFVGIDRYSTANRVACSVYSQCVQSGLVAAGHNAKRDKWNKDRELRQQFLTT